MKMNKRYYLIGVCCLLTLLYCSCVRDKIEPCPPLRVVLTVKDKNYFNIEQVSIEERRNEDLAFKEYVPTLYYVLRDVETGKVWEEQGVIEITGDEKSFPITFCDCVPHGKYELIVWGGLKDLAILGVESTDAILHRDRLEGEDLYVVSKTLVYDAWHNNEELALERTKGKLIIQMEDFPEKVQSSDAFIDRIYQQVDHELYYSGVTSVYKQENWNRQAQKEVIVKTILSPSLQKDGTTMKVIFNDQAGEDFPDLVPDVVKFTMTRNELTALKYVYSPDKIVIYILVNDEWEMLHSMDID